MTHRSAASVHNERLEFLGDAILSYLVADILFQRDPRATEGALTRARARLVRRETLAGLARALELGPALVLGISVRKSGGWDSDSILSDALEALIAAIYLDGGVDAVRKVVHALYADLLKALIDGGVQTEKDPKSRLQEYLQGRGLALPSYRTSLSKSDKRQARFVATCIVEALNMTESGAGKSRRASEQAAASAILERIAIDPRRTVGGSSSNVSIPRSVRPPGP